MINNTFDIDEKFPSRKIDAISKEKNTEVAKALNDLKDVNLFNKISEQTRSMIPQIDERIHYWESRRTFFLQIALGITAASLAGIIAISNLLNAVLVSKLFGFLALYLPLFTLCVILIIGGIRILAIWNEQNNPTYPFTKATRIWRWQYRHSETNPVETDCSKFSSEKVEEEAYKFANNLADYKIRLLRSDEKELLDQDISQLYLLLINEKYKIKFVSKLRDTLFSFLKASIIGTLLTLILTLFGYFTWIY